MGFLSDGKIVEQGFIDLVTKPEHTVIRPTDEQDINEHWDVEIDGVKFDIKGVKKVNRNDDEVNYDIHWIELKNVNGDPGWLYGLADYIAFEIKDEWLIVNREKLLNFVDNVLQLVIVDKPELYKMYSRYGRYDVITLIQTKDLEKITTKRIKK
jgi:hypothetical protein